MTDNIKDLKYEILHNDVSESDLSFKIIVIGDSGVGKSCFTTKATKNIFNSNYNATVGFEFFTFNIKINKKVIKLQIWDTCGQELYRSLITNFYHNASLALIVYAINSKESFNNIDIWLKELRTNSNPDVKIFLIGNKIDLEEERQVSKETGEKYAKDNKINKFIETSAKNGINAQSTFVEIAYLLYEDYKKYKKEDLSQRTYTSIKTLDSHQRRTLKKKKKSSCC